MILKGTLRHPKFPGVLRLCIKLLGVLILSSATDAALAASLTANVRIPALTTRGQGRTRSARLPLPARLTGKQKLFML